LWSNYGVMIRVKESDTRKLGSALIAIDEWLGLGDAVRQNSSLWRHVSARLVISIVDGPIQRTLEATAAPQVIGGLTAAPPKYCRVHIKGVFHL
jgi:hypothetical protein